jgi:hypothetical protein
MPCNFICIWNYPCKKNFWDFFLTQNITKNKYFFQESFFLLLYCKIIKFFDQLIAICAECMCVFIFSLLECWVIERLTHLLLDSSTDINIEGLTFLSRESFLKKNYLAYTVDNERHVLLQLLSENILLNLRTYDHDSLLLYANDHLNNFIQLHIQDGKYIVFTFNYGSKIHNITVEYSGKHHRDLSCVLPRNLNLVFWLTGYTSWRNIINTKALIEHDF